MSTDLTGAIPHGWSGGEAVTKWWRGKFVHLYRLHKNCAQCQKEMILDVTKAAITGEAKNAGLHLVRCPKCREQTPRDITSRPFVREDRATKDDTVDRLIACAPAGDEIEALRAQNEMFLQSVRVLTARNIELNAELVKIRNEMLAVKAQYELQPAMQAQQAKPVMKAPDPEGERLLAEWTAKNKMPWGS